MIKLEEMSENASACSKQALTARAWHTLLVNERDARSDFEVTQEKIVRKIDGKLAALP